MLNRDGSQRIVTWFWLGQLLDTKKESHAFMKNGFIVFSIFLIVTGCNRKPGAGGPQGGGGMPPIQVVAVEAKLQPVTESLSLVGSITPKEMVEIKAETDGIVQEINFKEGERVEKDRL